MPTKYWFRWIHGMCVRFDSKYIHRCYIADVHFTCSIFHSTYEWLNHLSDLPALTFNTTGKIVNCTKDDVIYDTRQFTSTIKSEFKLSCGDGLKNSLGQFPFHFVITYHKKLFARNGPWNFWQYHLMNLLKLHHYHLSAYLLVQDSLVFAQTSSEEKLQ